MRIRSIKPEFWRSRDIAALDWETRLLFIGLWSYVDDNGVGKDIDFDIAGDLFAPDLIGNARETVARVSRGLRTLFEHGLIYRYEVDGKPFLEIATWTRHQRIDKPNKPRYEKHDSKNAVIATIPELIRESVARVSRTSNESPATGTEEQRNRGTEDIKNTMPDSHPAKREYSPEFERFWNEYPVKDGKKPASKAFEKALRKISLDDLIGAVQRYSAWLRMTGTKPKWAQGWLNDERWNDPLVVSSHSQQPSRSSQNLEHNQQMVLKYMTPEERERMGQGQRPLGLGA